MTDILVFLVEHSVEIPVNLIFHYRPLAGQRVVLADVALVHDEGGHRQYDVGRPSSVRRDVDNKVLHLGVGLSLGEGVKEYDHVVILGVLHGRQGTGPGVIGVPCLLIPAVEGIEHADSGVSLLDIGRVFPISLVTE